ncbi:hypothetical protein HY383_01920 [Candidatus Daviesbacteria bacterium]|nr:hypothetical protein [Candidatus Daviesbacteria bacterium]
MKKLAVVGSTITALLTPIQVLAQDIDIKPPTQGYRDLGPFITNLISLAFIIALILVLVMIIWGALEWITSGGDKENVGKARGKIINALIGLAVLAVAFALFRFAGQFLGFNVGTGGSTISLPIPKPN